MNPREIILPPQDNEAIEIGDLYRKGKSSMVDSVRYLVEAGQRLITKKDGLRHGEWLPWLEANADVLGFDSPRTAQLLMRGAEKAKLASHLDEDAAVRISREIWGHSGGPRTLGTGEYEGYTPPKYIELARTVLGGIDLDPASSEKAQETVRAAQYFTAADEGLRHEWRGRVWLNPPYAQPLIGQFVTKMVEERSAGNVTAGIMLTHNYTDTSWFHEASEIADAACFTRGRIAFLDSDGAPCLSPAQGQTFFYFGDHKEAFAAKFLEIGTIWTPFGYDDGLDIPECLRRTPKAAAS
jgi:phage N-6-adenine-methyltransferase